MLRAPPCLVPGQRVGRIEQVLHDHAEERTDDRHRPAVGQSEIFCLLVGMQHLRPDDACHREHEHRLDVESHQNQVRGRPWFSPDGSIYL